MNYLYYLVFYSMELNRYSRWAVTAASTEHARERGADLETSRYRLERVEFVCTTSDDVCVEL